VIDYYTHLDMESANPVADLRARMRAGGVVHALVVEMWNGANYEAMRGLRERGEKWCSLAFCLREPFPQNFERGAILRVLTSHLEKPGPWLKTLVSRGGLLLPHADRGIGPLTAALKPLIETYPKLRVYVPHLGFPTRDKRPDPAWPLAIEWLSKRANVILGVSALAHFSAQEWPHEDIRLMLESRLRAFGPGRLVTGTDYPYLDKPRYGAYLALAHDWIRRWWPSWSEPDILPR
jgi:hypothetical protein